MIQVGDQVVVPRLGYDRPGRVVKLDQRKKTAKVAIGHVTWDVSIDELMPQAPRSPARPRPGNRASRSQAGAAIRRLRSPMTLLRVTPRNGQNRTLRVLFHSLEDEFAGLALERPGGEDLYLKTRRVHSGPRHQKGSHPVWSHPVEA